jgi:hypothetical protein
MSARGAVGRSNCAVALLEGEPVGRPAAFDPLALARRHGRGADLESAIAFFAELLLGSPPAPAWQEKLLAALGEKPALSAKTLRWVVQLILASPDAQLA